MAFTSESSFLLTTDGRVFSWGGHAHLGRVVKTNNDTLISGMKHTVKIHTTAK